VKKYNPDTIFDPPGNWVNAVELEAGERLLVTAGIVGITRDGELVADPVAQIKQAWKNVAGLLEGAGMTPDNLVKLTIYFTSAEHIDASRAARASALGDARYGMTGIIVQLVDPSMVIEIDVYAAIR